MVIYVCNVWSTLHAQKKAFEGLEKFWISQRSAKYAIMTIFADDPCGHTKAREGPNLSTMMVPQVGLFTRKFSERSIVVCHWVSFFTCTWPYYNNKNENFFCGDTLWAGTLATPKCWFLVLSSLTPIKGQSLRASLWPRIGFLIWGRVITMFFFA